MRRAFSVSTIQNFSPKPNQISYPYLSLIEKCNNLKDSNKIHAHIITLGLANFTYITSRILSFYVARNVMHYAVRLFDQIPTPTIFNWNAMMIGFSKSPRPEKSLFVYSRMRCRGVSPDMHTFPCLIKACSDRASMSQVHGQAIKFSFDGDVFVTSSLISGYCRLSEVELAYNVFDKSPNRNVLGERAGRRVIELEPGRCGRYVSLANVYAMVGRWEGVMEVRRAMRERGVKITPGWSLIEVDGVGHRFLVDDKVHPQLGEISKMLELVSSCLERMKDESL
ncbi:uncharacterized protein A4U43_C05F24610 [Asparagus officinalis]|uniref:Pentatricopeptide repeat-containing protein n=1 Tax=Asparagus officinalis TaxID=4686 RepID=A0A5P1EUX7_ASPOF|nr:uncharacterized protein A4U43_C05F24610 [Asparagus officinalis]